MKSRMGDIFKRAQCEALGQVQSFHKFTPRLSASRMSSIPGALSLSRRRFCNSVNPIVDSLSAVNPPPANPGLGGTLLTHSQRRIGLKKDPSSDKYHVIRAAKKAAEAAYIPAHPVPDKTRADAEEGDEALICPGCGVYMQDMDPMKPGYFRVPIRLEHKPDKEDDLTPQQLKKLEELFDQDLEGAAAAEEDENPKKKKKMKEEGYTYYEIVQEETTEVKSREKFSSPGDVPKQELAMVDASWEDVVEGNEEREAKRREKNLLKAFKREKEEQPEKLVVCARCHSLKYYGRVKEKSAEGLLPSFDFNKMVGQRLKTAYGKRACVLMVVDAADFDGSFPRDVAKLISEVEEKMAASFRSGTTGVSPRLIVAATKIDLLPGQISPIRLEQWVRRRVIMGGAPRPVAVHLVSSTKHWGVKALTERIVRVAGPRGDVWVVGSQNAGKSSLINALARFNVGKHLGHLTEASHPGTTIGILKMVGILPQGIKLFDTPGILQPHQLCLRLEEEELKKVQIRKELQPRTYRIMPGYSIHVGGYLRLDLVECPRTIYITVWASPSISMHMGKTFKAVDMFKKHLGVELQPPGSLKSWFELGDFKSQKIRVQGNSWEASSVDISIAGLGWVGIGLKGEAVLEVWTFDGIGVSTREALAFDYARVFETPGFTIIHQTKEKDYKKRPSNAENSFNRRKDRMRDQKARAARAVRDGLIAEPETPLIEEVKPPVEGEPLELW